MKTLVQIFAVALIGLIPIGSFAAPLKPENSYKSTNSKANDVNTWWTENRQEDAFVNVVKWWVNRVLGILALIALLYLMWGWFQMVTSWGDDDAYGKGFTILKHGATGLILIGIAWFIVSIIFWLVNKITESPGAANTNT